MADHHQGVSVLLLQAGEHHQDAPLHHHVQRGGGLIRQDDAGVHEGGQGDDGSLAHAAGELEGIGLQHIGVEV